jgi:hypothetical protein
VIVPLFVSVCDSDLEEVCILRQSARVLINFAALYLDIAHLYQLVLI